MIYGGSEDVKLIHRSVEIFTHQFMSNIVLIRTPGFHIAGRLRFCTPKKKKI